MAESSTSSAHPVDELMPAIRAALIRAFDQGRSSAIDDIRVAVGTPVAQRSRREHIAPKGYRSAQIVKTLQDGPKKISEVATHTGVSYNNADGLLRRLAFRGHVTKSAPGTYALAKATAP